jgi:adenylylsulfate kinase
MFIRLLVKTRVCRWQRKTTGAHFPDLGEVVGVDVPYEESEMAEVVVESNKLSAEESAKKIFSKLAKFGLCR